MSRSSGRRGRAPRAASGTRPARVDPAPSVPLTHPAFLIAIACTAISVMLSSGYRLHDTDLWQLLVVGKATWARHAIPRTDQWTWVGFGDPQITSSWAFRALIWPLWAGFGIGGLFAVRWAAMLASFGLLWLAARRMGARGLLALAVVAWGALAYRLRAEVRPESMAAVLIAFELWVLETVRAGGPDRRPWLIASSAAWVNLHVSWWLGFLLIGSYALDALARGRRAEGRGYLWLLPACALATLLNPFGLRAVTEPFAFALHWRHEPMFRNVVELWPVNWSGHRTDGLPALLAIWPALLLLRWRRAGPDLAGMIVCAATTYLGVSSQRFLGVTALLATPFVARDLTMLVSSLRIPGWAARPWTRGALVALVALTIGIPEWTRPELPIGFGIEPTLVPAAACDFMERAGVRGRMFNHFHLGGYLAYRAWPARERLPFATTQPENLRPELRAAYPGVFADSTAWRALEDRYAIDIAVLAREQDPGDRLLDFLDADTSWALVFSDDAVEVLVRRRGALAEVARREGYRWLPAGIRRRLAVVPRAGTDPEYRAAVRVELTRMASSSPANGRALHMLGILDLMDGRNDQARARLERALERDPLLPGVHELLGRLDMMEHHPRNALRQFELERWLHGDSEGIDAAIGAAQEALGDLGAARRAYRRELARHPLNADARAGLARLGER